MFVYRSQLVKCTTNCVSISDNTIPRSPSVKYHGVTLGENLSLQEHIHLKCRKAMANFVMIHNIWKFLTKDDCTTLVLGLCISHLDYANTLFYGLPDKTISHLQGIQKMCAKLTLKKSTFDSTTEALAQLHWLPIGQRINFKIATITHKCIYRTEPQYLKDLFTFTPISRNLRSSIDKTRLIVFFTKCKTFAAWSFSISALTSWNQLPSTLGEIKNFELFKRQLKTHYYHEAFYYMLLYRNLTLVLHNSINLHESLT